MTFSFTLLLTKESEVDFGKFMFADGEYELIHCRDIATTLIVDNDYFNSDRDTYDFVRLLAFLQEDKVIAVIISNLEKHMLLSDALTKLNIFVFDTYENAIKKDYLQKSLAMIHEIELIRTKPTSLISSFMKLITNKRIVKKNQQLGKKRSKEFIKIRNQPKKQRRVKEKNNKIVVSNSDW